MKKSILISAITFITSGLVLVPTGLAISPQTWYLFLISALGFAAIAFLLLLYGTEAINQRFSLINEKFSQLIANSDKAHSELSSAISEIQDKLESSLMSLGEAINTLQENTVEGQRNTVEEISSSVKLLTESNNKCLEEIKSVCKELESNESATIEKESERISSSVTNCCKQIIEGIQNNILLVNKKIEEINKALISSIDTLQGQICLSISNANDSLCSSNNANSGKVISSLNQFLCDISNLLRGFALENSKKIVQTSNKLYDIISHIDSTCEEFGNSNDKIITELTTQFDNVLDKVVQSENELVQSLKIAMQDNLKSQQNSVKEAINGMTEVVSKNIENTVDYMTLSFDDYKSTLTNSTNKIKDDFENSLRENQSGFNKIVRDICESLDDIKHATDDLQEILGGDLSDSLNNLASYIKHYDELKQSDMNTIKAIENICKKI